MSSRLAQLQALLSLGDRRVSEFIIEADRTGNWRQAMRRWTDYPLRRRSLDELLAWSAGITVTSEVAPYLFREPIAPSAAAELEHSRIEFSRILAAYHRLSEEHDFVIVEGAGGLMVPLTGGLLVADLVKLLALPLLVVTRPDLGTVNHTLAAELGLPRRVMVVAGGHDQTCAALGAGASGKEGDRVLLPAVRSAPPDTLVLAAPPPCQSEILNGLCWPNTTSINCTPRGPCSSETSYTAGFY